MQCANYLSRAHAGRCFRTAEDGSKYCRICLAATVRGERQTEARLDRQEAERAHADAVLAACAEIVDAAREARLHMELTPRIIAAVNALEKLEHDELWRGVSQERRNA